MAACGVDARQVDIVSENLIWNDLFGRNNHGVERLPILMTRVRKGLIKCPCAPRFERLSDALERLDGDDGFGQYLGELAVQRACALARAHGVGIVGVKDSNFFGTGAYFIHKAASAGMISLALSNSFSKVAPEGGVRPVLGTNPLAFGAPARDGRTLMIDMSTAGLAGSTIREHIRAGLALPEGLVIDADGQPIVDPSKSGQGALLPAAGAKGYGLGLIVEILGAVITGAGIGHEVASMYSNFEESGRSGHFFLALDVTRWMSLETYYERLEALSAMLRLAGPPGRVQLPGENRWRCFDENTARGIPLEPETAAALEALAATCGLRAPWT